MNRIGMSGKYLPTSPLRPARLLVVALFVMGCGKTSVLDGFGFADGDTNIDSNSDSDSDTDADIDTDTDTDLDTDTDTDLDTDTDTDLDTDTDTDTDSDTDSDSETAPVSHAYQQCGEDDNVHWFDSWHNEEEIVEDCPDEHGLCTNTSPTTAQCDCEPNWEIETNCTACIGNWDVAQECRACIENWDIHKDCGVCLNHWIDEDNDCGTCPGNWDPEKNCAACQNYWIDEDNDCGTCLIEETCVPELPLCLDPLASESPRLCNGLDDDCDGTVDEGCGCAFGEVQACFLGPPNFRNKGACTDGSQECRESGEWGPCEGGLWPAEEVCDDVDNDCDSCDDEDLCCDPPILCSYEMVPAKPFEDYEIDGTQIYLFDDVANWKWELAPGPCGKVLGVPSFTMNDTRTTVIEGPNASDLALNFSLSGNYELTLTVTTEKSHDLTCVWIINVEGPGLRVELCWDTTGAVDLDLHLGNLSYVNGAWATADVESDCFHLNCRSIFYQLDWGYPDLNGNPNPRLDLDNVRRIGVPENINLDNPRDGDMFRILVHRYPSAFEPITHPVVNVYCEGDRVATYGLSPELSGFGYNNQGWKVADVLTHVDGDGKTTCEMSPILGQSGEYWIGNYPFEWP